MKNYCLQLFATFTLVSLSPLFALATTLFPPDPDPDPPTTEIPTSIIVRTGNGGGDEIFKNVDCSQDMTFTVYVANLDLLTDINIGETLYPLPNNVPDLYMEFTVDGYHHEITELSSFEFSHSTSNGNVYKAGVTYNLPSISSDIHFSIVLLATEGSNSINFPNNVVPGYSLPTGYDYYPIQDYRSPGDLFPCDIVGWTDCYMEECSEITTCYQPVPHYPGIIQCGDDGIVGGGGGGDGFGMFGQTNDLSIQGKNSKDNSLFENLNIVPNPFKNNLRLEFEADSDKELQFELINSNGQVVTKMSNQVFEGANNLKIDLTDLPPGIYFARVTDQQNSYTKKLIKL